MEEDRTDQAPEEEQDTEGHSFKGGKADEGEDVEGHGWKGGNRADEGDSDDVEAHGWKGGN